MGALIKLVDVILFIFFLFIAVVAPLIDAQNSLPLDIFPAFLVDLKTWYIHEFNDYLFADKPNFFVGLVWLELLFQWPLAVASLYGIAAGKSWLPTTCLMFGVSMFTSMVSVLAELIWSNKASDKLLMVYYPILGFAVIAVLRGLIPHSGKTTSSIGKRPALNRKKRA